MTLNISYTSEDFPAALGIASGTLTTSWDELLWAALTIGRPSTYHVFRHGPSSFHEAIFRLSLVRLAVEQTKGGYLVRTPAFKALDPTEKGMVSYFLGMTLCKLFAWKLLNTPWLLHLDVYPKSLKLALGGRSRPDLFGQDLAGEWHAFESKGRSAAPTEVEKKAAKDQAKRLHHIGTSPCQLHIGSFAYFQNDELRFLWIDPPADGRMANALPEPKDEWRFHYEPSLSLAAPLVDGSMAAERELAAIEIGIHPAISKLLNAGSWAAAQALAKQRAAEFVKQGYQPDGIKVSAGDGWAKPLQERT